VACQLFCREGLGSVHPWKICARW